MTPETNALIPVGIAALCFLLAFLYGRHIPRKPDTGTH